MLLKNLLKEFILELEIENYSTRTLKSFLLDCSLEADNNAVEREIKPFIIERKNFLFANTVKGVKTFMFMV